MVTFDRRRELAGALPAGEQPKRQRALYGDDGHYADDGKRRRDVARTGIRSEEQYRCKRCEHQESLRVVRHVTLQRANYAASWLAASSGPHDSDGFKT